MFDCWTGFVSSTMDILILLVLTMLVTLQAYKTAQHSGRLMSGPTPYEGRVEMQTEEYGWTPVCDRYWDMSDAEILCRDIGYMEGATSHDSPRTGDVTLSIKCVVNVTCDASSTILQECSHNISNNCNGCYQAKATCNFYGYQGCYYFSNCNNNIWIWHDNMTIQYCVELCRNNDTSIAMLTGIDGSECICRDMNSTCVEWSDVSNAECNQVCPGADWQICGGGPSLASVYDAQMGARGGEYQLQTGTIYSPYFPGYYEKEDYCEWTIELQEDHISIRFTIFNLANDDDYVIVSEIYQDEERTIGNYSRAFPASGEIHSCSRDVLIIFQASDGEKQNGIFSLDFSGKKRCDNHIEVENGAIITDSDCPYRTGDIATVVCNPGYETNSSHHSVAMECQDGIWNETLPQCVERVLTTPSILSIATSQGSFSTELQPTAIIGDISELSIGLIVGVTIGIIAFLLMLIALSYVVFHRFQNARRKNTDDPAGHAQEAIHCRSISNETNQPTDPYQRVPNQDERSYAAYVKPESVYLKIQTGAFYNNQVETNSIDEYSDVEIHSP